MSRPFTLTTRASNSSTRKLACCLAVATIPAMATILSFPNSRAHSDASNARMAILNGIRYNQADRSVSIVLELSEHRPFILGRLDAGLYVDIENTRLSPALLASGAQLPSNSLIQVKTRQLRTDTARIVFQFDALARLQAVPLKNPSRILVEIDLPEQRTCGAESQPALGTPSTAHIK
jgi:hypothetical protein